MMTIMMVVIIKMTGIILEKIKEIDQRVVKSKGL